VLDTLSPHDFRFEFVAERRACEDAFRIMCTGDFTRFRITEAYYEDNNAPSPEPEKWHAYVYGMRARFIGAACTASLRTA
jgi:hypothetical protein